MAKRDHRVEALPVALIVACGVVALPALTFTTAWQLVGGPAHAQLTVLTGATALVSVLVGLVFMRLAVRELRGAVGIVIDDGGIHRRGFIGSIGAIDMAWPDIKRVEKLEFGVLGLENVAGKKLRICTYMFERREALERLFVARTGCKI